jgi:arylsulfatase A-like enzyme
MVWFMSDNGPNIKDGNAVYTSPTDPRFTYTQTGSSGPFKGKKGHLHEGGIRVPGILQWPAVIPVGFSTDYPVAMIDLVPTILDVTGINATNFLTGGRTFDGISVREVIEGGSGLRRSSAIPFKNDGWEAWVHHDYKIVRPKGSSLWELYHVENDPYETNQLQDIETAKFAELMAENSAYASGADAEAGAYGVKYPKGSSTGHVTPIQQWRLATFGIQEDTGNAADSA